MCIQPPVTVGAKRSAERGQKLRPDLVGWWSPCIKRIPYGPPRLHPPNSPPPNDKGGIEHAEQLMIGYAEDNDYVIDGMAVSRYLCEDCQDVITGYRNGWMKISVKLDPDKYPSRNNAP